ncbi:MAG: SRPBCC family protein [Armatimonadota bacterium]
MSNEENVIIIKRIFNAPREIVFEAWTKPECMMQWFGPKDYTIPVCKVDLRVGGAFFLCMRSSDGKDTWGKGIFREIIIPEKVVYTDIFADADGNTVPASYYGMTGDWPLEMLATVQFDEMDGKTFMILHHEGIPPGENTEMCIAGWNESFDKLDKYLAE